LIIKARKQISLQAKAKANPLLPRGLSPGKRKKQEWEDSELSHLHFPPFSCCFLHFHVFLRPNNQAPSRPLWFW